MKLPNTIPALYATDGVDANDKTIHARLFALGSAATWLIAEYNPEEKIAFGYADLFGQGKAGGAEWGYIDIGEMETLTYMGIPRVEVDTNFDKKPFTECINAAGRC
jgi:hypothetical protein